MAEPILAAFAAHFGRGAQRCFSAPGRVELGGNHTDHQHGCVLAAAVDLKMEAAVCENGSNQLRVYPEGFPPCCICLDELDARADEHGTTQALVRGIAAGFRARGLAIGGLDLYVRSAIVPGGGLSSSAAFEILLGRCLNGMFSCALTPLDLARIGQAAENRYYGKPCGLMDQLACAMGGITAMDFAGGSTPAAERIDFDFAAHGYTLCILDSRSSHAASSDDYAAITREMYAVSAYFGKAFLREVEEDAFFSALPALRARAGDRAVLRAIHFFSENHRAQEQARALRDGNLDAFLALAAQSGRSSWMYLQNVAAPGGTRSQKLAVTLAVCEHLLSGRGAVRVHGGGFGGGALAFVPLDSFPDFQRAAESALGAGVCREIRLAAP